MFVSLERLNPGEAQGGLPGWFSTHPNPENRIAAVKQDTLAWREKISQTQFAVNRDQYLKQIDGIVFGEDPRQGYVEGNVFYHPELRFQFPGPGGLEGQQYGLPSADDQSRPERGHPLLPWRPRRPPAAAAQAFVKESKAAVVKSESTKVNGMSAYRLISDVTTEQGVIRVMSYFIQKGQTVYAFLGYTEQSRFNGLFLRFRADHGSIQEPDGLRARSTSSPTGWTSSEPRPRELAPGPPEIRRTGQSRRRPGHHQRDEARRCRSGNTYLKVVVK
ncbi:MAG: hypothetical protein M0C28_25410 [Candidatus Moduliflexus flocculans]|nr:hypothetical protein [Candidatus Moduliflexus flocculans]